MQASPNDINDICSHAVLVTINLIPGYLDIFDFQISGGLEFLK